MKRAIVLAISVILALVVVAPVASGAAPSPSTQELAAAWWQWALEEPAGQNPLEGNYDGSVPPGDIQCDGRNPSGVWFLAGSTGGISERSCTIPAKKPLFFPVLNVICSPLTLDDPSAFEGGLPQCARQFTDETLDGDSTTFARVDGRKVTIVRAESGLFTVKVPENHIFFEAFGTPAGRYDAATDGQWVLLPALQRGQHVVTFGGDFRDTPFGNFELKTTYHLTVK